MAKITVKDGISFDAPDDKRLVLALEDAGVDILHRCGGFARCTTCRVAFHEGEPDKMTRAELDKLTDKGEVGQVRLSCQILCDHEMTVEPLQTLSNSGLPDPGSRPEDQITPEAEWVERPY